MDVEYVTYCYNIQEIIAKNEEIMELRKINQQIEVNILKKIKKLNMTREQYDLSCNEEEEEITEYCIRKKRYELQIIEGMVKNLEDYLKNFEKPDNK